MKFVDAKKFLRLAPELQELLTASDVIPATTVLQRTIDAINARNPDGSRKYRYIKHKGSSRSSKTYSLIDVYDDIARKTKRKRLTVWRDEKKLCKDTVLHDALLHFKNTNRYEVGNKFNKTESVFTYDKGSTFEIHGTDDEVKVMGLTQDYAWFNEPYYISKDTFDQIDQRTSECIILDLNPKQGHWSDDLDKDPRCITIHSTFQDNPFCPVEMKLKILSYQPVSRCDLVEKKLLTEQQAKDYDCDVNPKGFTDEQITELLRCRENEYKKSANEYKWSVYGKGEKAERPHRIFHWESCSYDDYLKIHATEYIGNDWGTVDPWGILKGKYYDGCLYLHELNYESENEIRARLTQTEISQINAEDAAQVQKDEKTGIVTWMYSHLGITRNSEVICDTNRLLKIAALRRAGYVALPAIKKDGSIKDGIDLLNDIQVKYTSISKNLEYEQENYSRKVNALGEKMEEPEDVDNHLMDCARYIAQYLQARGIIKVL